MVVILYDKLLGIPQPMRWGYLCKCMSRFSNQHKK